MLVDDADREDEGDIVVAAQFVTAETFIFMAENCRTFPTVPMTAARLAELGIPLMAEVNTESFHTPFTVTVDYRHGTTSGSSAVDRARTVAALIDPDTQPSDFASPGHVFPLRAYPGGLQQRRGHTEGAIELMRLAGLYPAAVISEVQSQRGDMMRGQELTDFARYCNAPVISIATITDHLAAITRGSEQSLASPRLTPRLDRVN